LPLRDIHRYGSRCQRAYLRAYERRDETGFDNEDGAAEGFHRAWPSIRDSNISTFITCIILYWFGNTFGAFLWSNVFALTLFLVLRYSLFSAITVTRHS